jgi:2-phospho-L-lactate/phosphoenolpyruvate guanylyltransferase
MSHPPTWAIVPVKALSDVKQRLATVLPLEARRRLMLVMLHDVLAALKQVESLGSIVIVSPDPHVAEIAERQGVLLLREARSSCHSAAVVAGLAYAKAHGVARAVTLPADVPLVSADEIRKVIDVGVGGVTLVASRDGDGSNAILFDPLDAVAPSFGLGSFARHRAQLAERGTGYRMLTLPGIGLDIDEPADLAELVQRTRGVSRYSFLTQCDLLSAGGER